MYQFSGDKEVIQVSFICFIYVLTMVVFTAMLTCKKYVHSSWMKQIKMQVS